MANEQPYKVGAQMPFFYMAWNREQQAFLLTGISPNIINHFQKIT